MKKVVVLLVAFILFFYPNLTLTSACTVLCVADSNQVFVGNNEDGTNVNAKAWIIPSDGKSYGYLAFGFEDAVAQGGMNDQGFVMDWATTTIQSLAYSKGQRYFKTTIFGHDFNEMVLRESANVEDAIRIYKEFYIPEVNGHVLLADKSGRSVIVEWLDGQIKVLPAQNNVQFMTNFDLAPQSRISEINDIRYMIMEQMLDSNNKNNASFEKVTDLLKATYQSGPNNTGTIYSNIYNLTTGDVSTIYLQDPNNVITWNLHEELSKNKIQVFDLKKMFAAPISYPALKDRNSQNPFATKSALQVFWVVGSLLVLFLIAVAVRYFYSPFLRKKWATAMFVTSLLNGLICLFFWNGLIDTGRYIRFQLTIYEKILYDLPYVIVTITILQMVLLAILWLKKKARLLDRILYSLYTAVLIGISCIALVFFIVGITNL
ncbi:carcinine hydrolase/isopenicillin-N N-acyltransferase family protein [Cohnella sp. WQ 127256]|uniref:carcinine hydrolase/isopenicillin-N N-acyltransferase family protein n=1 Tax=Cohnella sp. WQ 127256 TaxID=2938790 RepID=UPI0021174391